MFINKNLTLINKKIDYNCRKQIRNNLIFKTYAVIGTVHLISDNIKN